MAPGGYPFSLNSAVDALLKKEFDIHRAAGTAHPLMKEYDIDAVPYAHKELDAWRDSLRRGIQFLHEPTNLLIRGGVDDVWVAPTGELIIVDYKATSKTEEVSLDAEVSPIGYFVYCNGDADAPAFDGKLEFDIKVIPYVGNTDWVEPTIVNMHKCLMDSGIPAASDDCDYCAYFNKRAQHEKILS